MSNLSKRICLCTIICMFAIQGVWAKPYRHTTTGIELPDRMAALEKQVRVIDYEKMQPGLGVSVGYNGTGITVTVYIYTMGMKTIPDDLRSSTLKEHFKQAENDIILMEQMGHYLNVQKVSDGETMWDKAKGGATSLHTAYSYTNQGQDLISHLYLMGYRNHFLKIRFTYNKEVRKFAEKTQKNFLAEFSRILARNNEKMNNQDREAIRRYRKSAEQGDFRAQYKLGMHYAYGWGVGQDHVEAVKWLDKAAKQGDIRAQEALGTIETESSNDEAEDSDEMEHPEDDAEAIKRYRKSAEQGDAVAQGVLGACYYEGKGVRQDYAEAVKWFRKAAEQGHVEAQYSLGWCYAYAQGVERDNVEAVKWFRKATEQGNAKAQYMLGLCYRAGTGVEKDYKEAAKWFCKAAEQGLAQAQGLLGTCYAEGEGVRQDYAEAVKWFHKAADQRFVLAQFNLGLSYFRGEGVEQDFEEAVKWFRKAAEQGDAEAKKALEELEAE